MNYKFILSYRETRNNGFQKFQLLTTTYWIFKNYQNYKF